MRYAILGNNISSPVMAADLSLKGFPVTLYGGPSELLQTIKKRGGINISGVVGPGFAKIPDVTTSVKEAIKGVDIIMIDPLKEPVEQFRSNFLKPCISNIENGQSVIFTSGYHWALEFYKKLTEARKDMDVVISEMSIGPYAGMNIVGSDLKVGGLKSVLRFASIPSRRTKNIIRIVQEAFPQTLTYMNVLETSLNNPNHTLHSPILLCNAARVESTGGDFLSVAEGATPSVIRLMEAFDRERLSVIKFLGLESISMKKWLSRAYEAKGDSLYERMQDCYAYKTSKNWQKGKWGILSSDIPRGLIPTSSIASSYGLSTPITDMLIGLLSMIHKVDYRKNGLTLDELGLATMNRQEMIKFVTKGET